MTLILNLPPDLEEALKKRAASAGLDVSAYVLQTLKSMEVDELPPLPSGQFRAKLQAIIDLHEPVPGTFDDSRDSIYPSRGE